MMLTITYNSEADSGDQWNVPIGLAVGKMLKIGKLPVKVMAGADYSVVQEDNYGDEWNFKFMIIPVLPSLITDAIF